MIDIDSLHNLVKQYSQNRHSIMEGTYDETSARVDYIDKFFSYLGWDMYNHRGAPQSLRDVVHEANVEVEELGVMRNKKPDYLFQLNGNPKFFLEAKKPKVNILNEKNPAFQVRRYGWSAGMQFSVLTNFEDLVIYDCSIRPTDECSANVARIAKFHYTEYIDKIDEIKKILSRDSVEEETFIILESTQKTAFDDYFLKQVKSWRIKLACDIYIRNQSINAEDLNIFVQRFLNKSLFLRICEDKNLESYKQLLDVTDYNELRNLFILADKKYNSGLFHFIDGNEVEVSFNVFSEIFKDLYFPQSSYDFSVVPPSLLAKVYDMFLSEKIEINNDKVIIVKKPEAKDSLGAFSTPKNISDQIARKGIESRMSKSKVSLLNLKIADICCGSGIFLLSAFQLLCNQWIEVLLEEIDDAISQGLIVQDNGGYRLTFVAKKELLIKTIYGVDIDPSAVEVCKFSLLLECVSDLSISELKEFEQEGGALPDLDKNIVFGNSLVDNKFYEYISMETIDITEDKINEISPLSFVETFDFEGFDVIIGNPPYIRVQKMNAYSKEEYLYLRSSYSGYELRGIAALDKYYLFIERAIQLLNKNGSCGYIVPNKFIHEKNGKHLRKFLTERELISEIVNYNEIQLFKDALTYVCLLFLDKRRNSSVAYTSLTKKIDLPILRQMENINYYEIDQLSSEPWQLFSETTLSWYTKLDQTFKSLKEYADIFVGLQTSSNDLYYIKPIDEVDGYVKFIDNHGEERLIEREILREAIYKVKLEKYTPVQANRYLIYPYKLVEDVGYCLIPIDEMKMYYPMALKYFESNKTILLSRNIQNKTPSNYYQFGRSQSIAKFDSGNSLIWSVISLEANTVYCEEPVAYTGGGNGPYYGLRLLEDCEFSILYIQAILNAPFISQYIEELSVYFDGGYFSMGKQFMENIPIKSLNLENAREKEIHDRIVDYVQELNKLKVTLSEAKSSVTSTRTKRRIANVEREMNNELLKLYGVSN